MPSHTSKIHYLDHLRFWAILMIVMLHVVSIVRDQLGNMHIANWLVGTTFDGLGRAGVPIFVMISGALLIPRQESVGVFYKKRLSKVLVPFLVWAIFYAFLFQWEHMEEFKYKLIFSSVLSGHAFYHLWFMYMIIGLYLVAPFLRFFVDSLSDQHLLLLLGIWCLMQFFIPHVIAHLSVWLETPMSFGFNFPLSSYLGYFILGYYLAYRVQLDLTPKIYLLVYVAATGGVVFGTLYFYLLTDAYDSTFQSNMSPFVLLQAIALFLYAKRSWKKKPLKIISQISALSFGIYLIHPLVIEALDKSWLGFKWNAKSADTIFSVPSMYLMVLLTSILVTLIISKIPILRKIV